jgi:hypothetical protein
MKELKVIRIGRPAALVLVAATFSICLSQAEPPQSETTPGLSNQASTLQPSSTVHQTSRLPIIRNSNGLSLNWSGYAVSASDVTSVSATFTVPEVGPPGSIGGLTPDFSAWVGIDGYTSGTVEQTGIAGSWDDSTATATYNAWWEMYPRVSTTIRSMTISAGDSITASVTYDGGGSFTLSIADNTTGQAFSATASAPVGGPNVASRNSAEFIVERAATIDKGYLTILPLATFSTEMFTGATYTAAGTTLSLQDTVNNLTEYAGFPATPPPQPYWENITMVGVDQNGNAFPLDSISSVAGHFFTATFLVNGTPFPIPGVFRQK